MPSALPPRDPVPGPVDPLHSGRPAVWDAGRGVVVLVGNLDSITVPTLREALKAAARAGRPFVVDLTGVRYLEGVVVRVLLEFVGYRPIVQVEPGSAVDRVLQILEVDQLLELRRGPAGDAI